MKYKSRLGRYHLQHESSELQTKYQQMGRTTTKHRPWSSDCAEGGKGQQRCRGLTSDQESPRAQASPGTHWEA
jgi:hypothetical protein